MESSSQDRKNKAVSTPSPSRIIGSLAGKESGGGLSIAGELYVRSPKIQPGKTTKGFLPPRKITKKVNAAVEEDNEPGLAKGDEMAEGVVDCRNVTEEVEENVEDVVEECDCRNSTVLVEDRRGFDDFGEGCEGGIGSSAHELPLVLISDIDDAFPLNDDTERVSYDVYESVAERMAYAAEQEEGDGRESDSDCEFNDSECEESDISSVGGSSEDDDEWVRSRQKLWAGKMYEVNEEGHAAEIRMTCTICKKKDHNRRSCPEKGTTPSTDAQALQQQSTQRGRPRKDGGPPRPRLLVDPNQPTQKRGRPCKAPVENVPQGMGVNYGPDQRIYINHGFPGATILSQRMDAPAPSQPSQQ